MVYGEAMLKPPEVTYLCCHPSDLGGANIVTLVPGWTAGAAEESMHCWASLCHLALQMLVLPASCALPAPCQAAAATRQQWSGLHTAADITWEWIVEPLRPCLCGLRGCTCPILAAGGGVSQVW